MMVTTITTIVHFFLTHFFVMQLNLGIAGTGISMTITCFANLVLLTVLTSFEKDIEEALFFPSFDSFSDLTPFLKVGIPSFFMIGIGLWCMEMMAFLAGRLSVTDAAASIILLNIQYVSFSTITGIALPGSTLMGKEIGAKNHEKAYKYMVLITLLTLTQVTAYSVLFYVFRIQIAKIFTDLEHL